jgi:pyroglutamyl-peptidase
MRILVTGFEPFGGSSVNPSQQVVLALQEMTLPGVHLTSLILKVDQEAGPATILELLGRQKFDAILCLGEAARSSVVSVERVAINLMDFRIADNAGNQAVDQPVIAGAAAAYFATLPVRAIVQAIQAAGVPAEISLSAGSYLCNQVLYVVLHDLAVNDEDTRAGFIHLPALPEEAVKSHPQMSSMALETSLKAVQAAIAAIQAGLEAG